MTSDAPPALPGVEHRFVEARHGVRLHVAEAGDPGAPPVVLLHGWPQHWWMWRHQIPPLAEDRRVLAVDLRGFGWSDAPAGGYRKDELAADVLGMLDALGIERTALVGHDWGGFLTYLLALRHPERVERAVVLSVPPPGARIGLRRLPALQGFAHVPVLGAPLLGPLAAGSRAFHGLVERAGLAVRGAWTDQDRELYLSRMADDPARARAAAAVYRTFLWQEAPIAFRGRPATERVDVPLLALHGERDPVSAALAPAAEVVPGAGHFLPEEAPHVVTERIRAFLQTGAS
jgi:pimeloyl-ACP methyl ester carboxylesterase